MAHARCLKTTYGRMDTWTCVHSTDPVLVPRGMSCRMAVHRRLCSCTERVLHVRDGEAEASPAQPSMLSLCGSQCTVLVRLCGRDLWPPLFWSFLLWARDQLSSRSQRRTMPAADNLGWAWGPAPRLRGEGSPHFPLTSSLGLIPISTHTQRANDIKARWRDGARRAEPAPCMEWSEQGLHV
jgi:hypothetical protein